jgi:DNA-binding winged helix-turn-helix (wHTH) protein/tetratricopeptide (TPR) repeat protein
MPSSGPSAPHLIEFPPFQLDLRGGMLRQATTPVALRPKTFAVLQYLAERPGDLVTKQALLDSVWGDVAVTEDVVRLSIRELRVALADDPTTPRFIQTVPRRGYRFIAAMGAASVSVPVLTGAPPSDGASWPGVVVGRASELAEIADAFRGAANGRRQVMFVSGEAGIGKTTLVDAALEDLRRATGPPPLIGRGQCVEQYGGGEPYLPVLQAMAAICRGSDGRDVEAVLIHHAPDWLLRALGLAAQSIAGATASTHEHTLHKLAASIDALSAEIPLVLVLEDLQWSDHATLDLLSVLAQRREPARLLVLCTLRPANAIAYGHPVATAKRELLRKSLCREIPLGGLSAADVASYLAARFPGAELPQDLLPLLVDRSDGNPFFLVTLVDHLLERDLLVGSPRWELRAPADTLRTAIPSGIRAVIEPRLEHLPGNALRVLQSASVSGVEFAAHAVAGVAPRGSDLGDVEYIEQLCDGLAVRQEILRASGESAWPDGTTSARYAFAHALYREVIYQSLSSSARRRLHQVIGERLEQVYDERTAEVASELAAHFGRSGDGARAVRYHGEAAAHARSRFAYQEARLHLDAALALQGGQPETPERQRQEALLLQALGSTLFSLKGHGDEDAARAFARMRELAERLDDAALQLRAMDGLLLVHTMRAELTIARELAEKMIDQAEQLRNPVAIANTRVTLGGTLFYLGELAAAHRLGEDMRRLSDTEASPLSSVFGISSCCLLASTYALFGQTARARAMIRETVDRAATYGVPYFRAQATNLAARASTLLRDATGARALAAETLQIASAYGFTVFRIQATMVLGWCDVEDGRVEEGLAALRDAFREYGATGQRVGASTFSALLAEAHLASGDANGANQVLHDALALAAVTGERVTEPELYRLQGECQLVLAATRAQKRDAAASFERALAIAAQRNARLFELRAATSLLRLRGKAERERVTRLVERFAAEDDCVDLQAARALLVR